MIYSDDEEVHTEDQLALENGNLSKIGEEP